VLFSLLSTTHCSPSVGVSIIGGVINASYWKP
jgi:hypothetical protein